MPDTPEQLARQQIDAQFVAAGWVVQDYRQFNPAAGRGIALREAPLKSGRCDYLLLVDRKAVGVTEAKKQGTLLSGAAEQSGHYAENLPDFIQSISPGSLPFLYESTGVETFFRDERDPDPRSRRVFSFHRPETLAALLAQPDTLRARLAAMPTAHPLPVQNLRACQVEGITNLEESFAAAHPRALIQSQGFDAAAKAKASALLKSFREYIEQPKAEITALQILYSRPYKQRLTEKMLKELEAKLKEPFGSDPVNTLWRAFELVDNRPHPSPLPRGEGESHPAPSATQRSGLAETRKTESPLPEGEGQGEGERKRSRSAIHRFADLVPLVRFALEQQPVLAPFADSVSERFHDWVRAKDSAISQLSTINPQPKEPGTLAFTPDQLSWLGLIKDHTATAISIEPEDLELSPFNQRGALGKAHQLFGEQLPKLLDELNEVLAA